MKIRWGKNLRKFLQETEHREFHDNEMTQGTRRNKNDTAEIIKADIDGLLSLAAFFLEERFIKHLVREPHSLFSVFDFCM